MSDLDPIQAELDRLKPIIHGLQSQFKGEQRHALEIMEKILDYFWSVVTLNIDVGKIVCRMESERKELIKKTQEIPVFFNSTADIMEFMEDVFK